MRASTVFALFIALLLGLAALASARYFGWFRTPVVALPPKVELPKVLVAKKNLYEDIAMTPADVEVRELTVDELKDYQDNPGKYLPPKTEAASMRVLNRNLGAGHIIMQEYLRPPGIPEGLGTRLPPGMVGVHVEVSKDQANGGLIRIGDHVDVYLTTKIDSNSNAPASRIGYAPIARGLPVVFKRDQLWPVVAPVPEGKPLSFTLAANPYRAALIEFAKHRGQLTLVPVANPAGAKSGKLEAPTSWDDPNSAEYKDENSRIAAVTNGVRPVSDADLERIFHLPPLANTQLLEVELYKGNDKKGKNQYVVPVNPSDLPPVDPDRPNYGYSFSNPISPVVDATPNQQRPGSVLSRQPPTPPVRAKTAGPP